MGVTGAFSTSPSSPEKWKAAGKAIGGEKYPQGDQKQRQHLRLRHLDESAPNIVDGPGSRHLDRQSGKQLLAAKIAPSAFVVPARVRHDGNHCAIDQNLFVQIEFTDGLDIVEVDTVDKDHRPRDGGGKSEQEVAGGAVRFIIGSAKGTGWIGWCGSHAIGATYKPVVLKNEHIVWIGLCAIHRGERCP